MPPPFQVTALVASPLYPNSIAWSDENLIAVATGHLVTILNPEKPHSPRGVISLTAKDPFPVGTVDRKELLSACLLPTSLARDRCPCVRSISWSPPGFASNYGCLLGVCTTDGSVKIYSYPYCEFRAEWTEVMDLSDILCGYIAKDNYGEHAFPLLSQGTGPTHDLSIQVVTGNSPPNRSSTTTRVPRKMSGKNSSSLGDFILSFEDDDHNKNPDSILQRCSSPQDSPTSKEDMDYVLQIVPTTRTKRKSRDKREDCTSQHITADKYASRCALISSLVIVWSPVVSLSAVAPDNSCISYCLLAVGSKSGHISFWRFHTPDTYSIEHNCAPKMVLAGLQQVHDAWVTALAWGLFSPDGSNPQLLLASGSSDGSVKIWSGDGEDMLGSTESNRSLFSLLTEVKMDDTAPISVLSLTMCAESCHTIALAIGKGSGSVELWTFSIDKQELKTAGCYSMHDLIVTGLAWDFDGCCLYSCSQDNSLRGWMFDKDTLTRVPLPSNNLISIKSPVNLSCAYDSCFGVAVSPGNMVLAVVRSFDLDLLNPMYQARTQRAAIEFFWLGGQQQRPSSEKLFKLGAKTLTPLSEKELLCWGSNILWSLKQFESHKQHLVVWDIMTALSALKLRAPAFFEQILLRWLVFLEGHSDLITKKSALSACRSLPKVPSRQLHLLNVFCRRVMLPSFSASESQEGQHWVKLLLCSEGELRKRLVAFNFSFALRLMSDAETQKDGGRWKPSGLAQMVCWVKVDADGHQLKHLASQVEKLSPRFQDAGLYEAKEACTYCSAPIDFESAESSSCRGLTRDKASPYRHKLTRCAVSIRVCPSTPLWFCVCCERRSFQLAPRQLYRLSGSPFDCEYEELLKRERADDSVVALCPFCGILVQRLQPDFLMSCSPV